MLLPVFVIKFGKLNNQLLKNVLNSESCLSNAEPANCLLCSYKRANTSEVCESCD